MLFTDFNYLKPLSNYLRKSERIFLADLIRDIFTLGVNKLADHLIFALINYNLNTTKIYVIRVSHMNKVYSFFVIPFYLANIWKTDIFFSTSS